MANPTFFDESYYLSQNSDVLAAVAKGIFTSGKQHYDLFGGKELRNPDENFDASYYLTQNTDVLAAVSSGAFATPLDHFRLFGSAEGRVTASAFAGFDSTKYLADNADVAAAVTAGAFTSAFDHYYRYGIDETRAAFTTSGTTITPPTGTTTTTSFTLTTSADTINTTSTVSTTKTTSNADTIEAGAGRLGSDDSIDGGGGNDILNITLASGAAPIVRNVETVNISLRGAASALDFRDFSGVTKLNVYGSLSGQIGGLPATAAIYISSGFSNNVKLNLDSDSGTADAITIHGNSASAFTLDLSGIETLNLAAGSTVTLANTANATQLRLANVSAINVTGTANVTLFFGTATAGAYASAANLSAINASALAGSLTLDIAETRSLKISGGTGNDAINVYTALDTLDTIDGGAGTDTVRAKIDNGLSTVRPTLTNVEVLQLDSFSTGATVDLRNSTALTTLTLNGATASASITEMEDALTTINIRSGIAAVDVGLTYASGTALAVTVNLGATGTATGGLTIGDINVANNTGTVTLNSDGKSANTMSGLGVAAAGSVTINAGVALTIGNISAVAAGSLSIVASANVAIGTADLASASTITIQGTGTASVSATNLIVGDDFAGINISAGGNVSIAALTLTTAATAVAMSASVSIGSGSTAAITLANASAGSALDRFNLLLAGSGNVDFAVGSGLTAWARGSAVIDALSLGGSLDVAASAATGITFNVTLSTTSGASGGTISLGSLADSVVGGASADVIEGGGGNDQLFGGAGSDVFVYISSAGSGVGAGAQDGTDVLGDFSTADTLYFNSFSGLGTANFTALNSSLTASNSAFFTSITSTASAVIAIFQRGSDVVVQVYLATGAAAAPTGLDQYVEVILQGETLATAALATAANGFTLSNIVVS